MNLHSLMPIVFTVSLGLFVFTLGLQATFADATFLFRHPRLLIRGCLSMIVIMPIVALIIVLVFHLNPAVKIVLVALSVSPVPPFFPKKALKAGGKENYTIGLLVATVVLAIVSIPLTMEILEKVTGVPLHMSPMSVATIVLKSALAPLLMGIAVRTVASSFADRVTKPIAIFAGVLLILVLVLVLFGSVRAVLPLVGDGTLLSLAAFALIGYFVGYLFGGPNPEQRSVLSLATASRHPAIAVAIAHANFPDQKLTGPLVVIYLIVSGVVPALASKLMSKAKTPVEGERQVAG